MSDFVEVTLEDGENAVIRATEVKWFDVTTGRLYMQGDLGLNFKVFTLARSSLAAFLTEFTNNLEELPEFIPLTYQEEITKGSFLRRVKDTQSYSVIVRSQDILALQEKVIWIRNYGTLRNVDTEALLKLLKPEHLPPARDLE